MCKNSMIPVILVVYCGSLFEKRKQQQFSSCLYKMALLWFEWIYVFVFFSDDYFNYLIDIMWWLIILTLVFHRKQCHSNLFFKSEIVSVAKNAHTMWCLNLNDRPKDFQQGVKGSVCTFPINPIPRLFVVVVCLLHKSPVKKKVITIQFFYIVDKNRALL